VKEGEMRTRERERKERKRDRGFWRIRKRENKYPGIYWVTSASVLGRCPERLRDLNESGDCVPSLSLSLTLSPRPSSPLFFSFSLFVFLLLFLRGALSLSSSPVGNMIQQPDTTGHVFIRITEAVGEYFSTEGYDITRFLYCLLS
jgi:hypothetical protein